MAVPTVVPAPMVLSATPLGLHRLLAGLMLRMDWSLDLLKVLLILVFVLATNPTAAHAMAKAALHGGQGPRDETAEEDPALKP